MSIDTRNLKTNINVQSGGSVAVTIGSGGTAQGPNIPCRYCRLQSRSGNNVIRVRVGSPCDADSGVGLAGYPTLTPYAIHNLNLLYFYGNTEGDIIDIEYFV